MKLKTSNQSFWVDIKDEDGNVTNSFWSKYKNKQHRATAKAARRKLRKNGPKPVPRKNPWGNKRKRHFRLKPNDACPCGAQWPEDDPVTVRAGKAKKFKKCCM